jgi:hypothetical protein
VITKKAQKLMKKLPNRVKAAVHAADNSEAFGSMLKCSSKTMVSIKLPNGYRLVKNRDTLEVLWVGTHNDYNKLITRGGHF